MAHRLVRGDRSQSDDHSTKEPTDGGGKYDINRRGCLKAIGATAAALTIGGAASSAAVDGTDATTIHWTNFSEGQL